MDKLMREQFEELFSRRGFSMKREESRGWYYVDIMTEGAWRGWQAALDHQHKQSGNKPYIFQTHADEALDSIKQEKRTKTSKDGK